MQKLRIFIIFLFFITGLKANCATVWINDSRTMYQADALTIMAINIRNFNSNDINKNGIIEEKYGEIRGNFTNAIERLDKLASWGINAIHVMPITPVGKLRARGTAGSLYALSSFSEINPQLLNPESKLSPKNQAFRFIDEAHRRKIRVFVDLPAFVSYDFYLKQPYVFQKYSSKNVVLPSDWTDLRLLDAGSGSNLNKEVMDFYKSFVDMLQDIGADGIVAQYPEIKSSDFWKELIDYARLRNPEFLFLAQTPDKIENPVVSGIKLTPYTKLLEVGFDGYDAGYSRFLEWKTSKDLFNHIAFNKELFSKYKQLKSTTGSFASEDMVSPVLSGGVQYSIMISWLNATLPLNGYFVDGFQTGDNYLYPLANKKAEKTYSDCNIYYNEKGKFDVYNFTKRPDGSNGIILKNFVNANRFKFVFNKHIQNARFVPLETSSDNVFAYARSNNENSIIVIGNMDFKNMQSVKVFIPGLSKKVLLMPVKIDDIPKISRGKLFTILAPGEIQVISASNFSIK